MKFPRFPFLWMDVRSEGEVPFRPSGPWTLPVTVTVGPNGRRTNVPETIHGNPVTRSVSSTGVLCMDRSVLPNSYWVGKRVGFFCPCPWVIPLSTGTSSKFPNTRKGRLKQRKEVGRDKVGTSPLFWCSGLSCRGLVGREGESGS